MWKHNEFIIKLKIKLFWQEINEKYYNEIKKLLSTYLTYIKRFYVVVIHKTVPGWKKTFRDFRFSLWGR